MTSRRAFEGKDAIDALNKIIREPVPALAELSPSAPPELQRVVRRCLAKDPDERYQSIKDIAIELKELRREMKDPGIDTTVPPPPRNQTTVPPEAQATQNETLQASGPRSASSVEYIVDQAKLHKRVALVMMAIFVITTLALSYFLFFKSKRAAALTDKDTILLTEFDNRTGEEVFDVTLRQGLTVQLQQSPFLDIYPDQPVRETLRLMSRSPDERVTREVGREICQRQGLKAYIAGTIAKFDRNYSLTLEALNGQTGDSFAIVQVEAEGKDQVLRALSRAATDLREKLGESLSSIQKFDAPLEQATTSSLEALKAYSIGAEQNSKGKFLEAISSCKHAIELDPMFASAYARLAVAYRNSGQPGPAAEAAQKAFDMRERVSEREKLYITAHYYTHATGEINKEIEALELIKQIYPRDRMARNNLGLRYALIAQYEKAIEELREAIRLNPSVGNSYRNLSATFIRLNRFEEAKAICEQSLAQNLDSATIRGNLYNIAFLHGDTAVMKQQVDWSSGKPDEHRAVDWRTQTTSFAGEWRKSQDHLRRSTDLALDAEAKEVVAGYTANQAVRAAWSGQSAQAVTLAEAALKIEHNRDVLVAAALAFALSGETAKAQPLIQELEQKHPKDSLVNQLWLPKIKAALALSTDDAQAALDLLEPARRFEAADEFHPQTLRVMAY